MIICQLLKLGCILSLGQYILVRVDATSKALEDPKFGIYTQVACLQSLHTFIQLKHDCFDGYMHQDIVKTWVSVKVILTIILALRFVSLYTRCVCRNV